jgi:multisubunit Na+/H+ antiporter MnhF subunit
MTFSINHVVAVLGAVLSLAVYLVMRRYSVPDRLCLGAAILSALVVSIFWTSVLLGTSEDDE